MIRHGCFAIQPQRDCFLILRAKCDDVPVSKGGESHENLLKPAIIYESRYVLQITFYVLTCNL